LREAQHDLAHVNASLRLFEATAQGSGLSRATINRRLGLLSQDKYPQIEVWLADLVPIYQRVNQLRQSRGQSGLSWQAFFGSEFPLPPSQLGFEVLARTKLADDRLVEAVAPLIEHLTYLYESTRDKEDVWKASQILAHLCNALELGARWHELAKYSGLLAALNRRTDDFHFAADALLRRGQALYHLREFDAAESCLEDGLKEIDSVSNKTPPYRTQLRLLNYLAIVKSEKGQHAEAIKLLRERCLRLAEMECSGAAIASVQNRLGIINLNMGLPAEAKQYLIEALDARVQMGMITEASRTLFSLGRAFRAGGELRQAVFVWQVARLLQQRYDDLDMLGETELACGELYADLLDSDFPLNVECSPAHFNEPRLHRRLGDLSARVDIGKIHIRDAGQAARLAVEFLMASGCHLKNEELRQVATSRLILIQRTKRCWRRSDRQDGHSYQCDDSPDHLGHRSAAHKRNDHPAQSRRS
jgi:tetratricopeptide (TPR) repeat protein